jgi:hypothetical protein
VGLSLVRKICLKIEHSIVHSRRTQLADSKAEDEENLGKETLPEIWYKLNKFA